MNDGEPPFKDILYPYFELIPEHQSTYQCTVYGPKKDVEELRKKIEEELGIQLPSDLNSFNIYVKNP